MRNFIKSLRPFGVILCLLGWSSLLMAKDLANRLGVGFVDDSANHTPAMSVKYGLSKDMQLGAALGFQTTEPDKILIAGRFYKNIFYETNLNFYSAFGLGYLKLAEHEGVELMGLLGAEFFIPGIDSLGLSFETGVNATNLSGTFVLKTVGYTFLGAGIHFYF